MLAARDCGCVLRYRKCCQCVGWASTIDFAEQLRPKGRMWGRTDVRACGEVEVGCGSGGEETPAADQEDIRRRFDEQQRQRACRLLDLAIGLMVQKLESRSGQDAPTSGLAPKLGGVVDR